MLPGRCFSTRKDAWESNPTPCIVCCYPQEQGLRVDHFPLCIHWVLVTETFVRGILFCTGLTLLVSLHFWPVETGLAGSRVVLWVRPGKRGTFVGTISGYTAAC